MTTALAHDIDRNLALDYVPIDVLHLDPENARVHKPAQVRQIAKSIEAFGFNAPILVDKGNKVIAGHGRLLACKHLGWIEVPVIRLEHLSPAQARAYAIADNRLTETSSWNDALLTQHMKLLSEMDLTFDIEATGFTMGEIDLRVLGLEDRDENSDPDDHPPDPGPAVAKSGDLWTLGSHRILCGSALETESYRRLMGESRAAMVFTDPPYNVKINGHVSGKGKIKHREFAQASGEMTEPEFTAWLGKALRLMADASTDGALQFICMDWRHAFALQAAARPIYSDLLNICVWTKPNGGMGGLYRSAHELVLVFKAGSGGHRNNVQLGKFGRNRTNVWSYPGSASFRSSEEADLLAQHPTPKPVRLIADAILDVTAAKDVILDPFLGSGSTLIAAERMGRQCRGIEIDPLYVDLSIRRWQRATGQSAIREDGSRFDDLVRQAEGGVS